MSVRIRLRRIGSKKNPFYRIIVADSRKPRGGRYIENLGTYDPLHEPSKIQVDESKLFEWLKNGAQPSDPVWDVMTKMGLRQKWEMLKRGEDVSMWQPPERRPGRGKGIEAAAEKKAEPVIQEQEAPEPVAAEQESPETSPAVEEKVKETGAAAKKETVKKEKTEEKKTAKEQKQAGEEKENKKAAGKDESKAKKTSKKKEEKPSVEKT